MPTECIHLAVQNCRFFPKALLRTCLSIHSNPVNAIHVPVSNTIPAESFLAVASDPMMSLSIVYDPDKWHLLSNIRVHSCLCLLLSAPDQRPVPRMFRMPLPAPPTSALLCRIRSASTHGNAYLEIHLATKFRRLRCQ